MKRTLVLLCLAIAGCARMQDMTSDAFSQGNVPQEIFVVDSRGCEDAAKVQRDYEIRGIAADNVDRHRIYNRAYAACMKAKGYKEQTGLLNFWQAYDL